MNMSKFYNWHTDKNYVIEVNSGMIVARLDPPSFPPAEEFGVLTYEPHHFTLRIVGDFKHCSLDFVSHAKMVEYTESLMEIWNAQERWHDVKTAEKSI